MKLAIKSIIAAIALVGLSGVAHAETRDSGAIARHVVVRYDDLDLQSPNGGRQMLARLNQAAERACGGRTSGMYSGATQWAERRLFAQCRASALQDVVARLDQPEVTTAFAQAYPWRFERFASL